MACYDRACINVEESWSNWEKWLYVRSFFINDVRVPDVRDINDPARIADEVRLQSEFDYDVVAWSTYNTITFSFVPFERWLQWRWEYGTEEYGNLPQFLANNHVGRCWAPCPYDSNCPELRTRLMLGLSDLDPLPTRVPHVIGDVGYYMKQTRHSEWGYECTYDGCTYLLSNSKRYFYV